MKKLPNKLQFLRRITSKIWSHPKTQKTVRSLNILSFILLLAYVILQAMDVRS